VQVRALITDQGPDCCPSAALTDRPVVASGGVSSLDDLRVLAVLVPGGVEGAIVVVQVAALIDPRMLIEVERLPGAACRLRTAPSANLPSANLLLGRSGITARVSRRRLGLSDARPMCQAGPLGQERRIDLGDRFRAAVSAPRDPSRQPPRPMRSPRPAR